MGRSSCHLFDQTVSSSANDHNFLLVIYNYRQVEGYFKEMIHCHLNMSCLHTPIHRQLTDVLRKRNAHFQCQTARLHLPFLGLSP
jgi:hypothetical protein